ncbi:hypothetical protein H3H37_01245 [Duganella sp. LX20W]|uniref:Papain-like cysteine protease AvrRpt2 n=1 Tax=Rugamonas brunnea TaxID=2758569 RepID=A0A7W2ENF5_9BURK|nr:papain-like cysteine protease family protein [Rugamonas brunnea]MBA5635677.1 hypothetical protein [Rugamonas brunnea]
MLKQTPIPAGAIPPAAPAHAVSLPMIIQHQEQDQWCWAAVTTSIASYYQATSAWTQCSLACAELGNATCCADGSIAECDKPWFLNLALSRVQHLQQRIEGQIDDATIIACLSGGQPIGIRIQWADMSGHFIAIVGIRKEQDGTVSLALDDPIYGPSTHGRSDLAGQYQGAGTWTHTYTTQK